MSRSVSTGRVLAAPRIPTKAEREENDVSHRPRVFADNGYLFSGDSTPLLVAKDRRTGMTFAAAVSMKGGGDPHAARLHAKWICELIRRVRELRAEGTTTVDEISPPSDSAGNGIAERAILTVGGLVRTTKAVVKENVLEGRSAAW